jgi:predicted metalloprotease with PDZ domain
MARCRHNDMRQTAGRRSLDDFARQFFQQGRATCPKVVPYTLSEIVSTSNTIEPNKLAGFLRNEDLDRKSKSVVVLLDSM